MTDQDNTTSDAVATPEDNAKLEHSQGGVTTRDDRHDLGVPMIAGSPAEPVGPEDALGVGDKRGDYAGRIVGDPHTSVALDGGGELQRQWVDAESGKAAKEGAKGAVQVPSDVAPRSEVVSQLPRVEQVGDATGIKGGVDTDPASPAGRAYEAGRDAASS